MKINKPKFWDKEIGLFSICLLPLTLIVKLLIILKKNFSKTVSFKVPIICVGNIYLGGTGKTPTSILVANELLKFGKNPIILRKYYKNHEDEHNLIKNNFKNLALEKNRADGIARIENSKFDTVILDDGFQDYNIKKDLSIVCFNKNQMLGNGLILPAGPLRDSLNSLKYANIVLINGGKVKNFEKKILKINKNLKIFYSHYKPTNLNRFKNKKLLALAGIGNPENFFKLLENHKLDIKKKIVYPDHHLFSKNQIQNIVNEAKENNYQIITTEKDYYKIAKYKINEIQHLKVALEIVDQKKLFTLIEKLYD